MTRDYLILTFVLLLLCSCNNESGYIHGFEIHFVKKSSVKRLLQPVDSNKCKEFK